MKPPSMRCLVDEDWLLDVFDTLTQYKDETAIIDHILLKSREITSADAGTIYLLSGDELIFRYTHNDSLFSADDANKYAYANMRIPVSKKSLVGYVAVTCSSLNIADVRKLSNNVPYKFNESFDLKTGYRTVSVLAVPIVSRSKLLLGVLQLINSLDSDGKPRPFSNNMEKQVMTLVGETAAILESGRNVSQGIERLVRIINLHDGAETSQHVHRVGAIAAELYQQWARKRGEALATLHHFKSRLRLAAMLHDIGKVGVSSFVLHKEEHLNDEERSSLNAHAWIGSTLFSKEGDDISELVPEIALHHHQKWDGTGYGGFPGTLPLSGEDIPLAARITALADVFDCLVSQRNYRHTWNIDDVAALICREAGRHFDPELVERFLEIQDVVAAIYAHFPDE